VVSVIPYLSTHLWPPGTIGFSSATLLRWSIAKDGPPCRTLIWLNCGTTAWKTAAGVPGAATNVPGVRGKLDPGIRTEYMAPNDADASFGPFRTDPRVADWALVVQPSARPMEPVPSGKVYVRS
jgi:hypothetical protein